MKIYGKAKKKKKGKGKRRKRKREERFDGERVGLGGSADRCLIGLAGDHVKDEQRTTNNNQCTMLQGIAPRTTRYAALSHAGSGSCSGSIRPKLPLWASSRGSEGGEFATFAFHLACHLPPLMVIKLYRSPLGDLFNYVKTEWRSTTFIYCFGYPVSSLVRCSVVRQTISCNQD